MSQPPQQSTVNFNQFFHECYELSRQAKNEDDFLHKAGEQLGEMVDRLIQRTVGDKVEKMVESTDEKIKALEASSVNKDERITNLEVTLNESRDKYLTLEKRVKSSENREKRNQKASVANNIIVKTSKTQGEIVSHLVKAVKAGLPASGGQKPTNKDFQDNLHEIVQKTDKTNDQSLTDKKTYKVFLNGAQKKALFEGLSSINKKGSASGILIQNEIPHYLKNYNRELERVSYTLRHKYQAENLRTKICPDGLSLQMVFKMGNDKDWTKATSDVLSEKLETLVTYRDNEKKPIVIPTCKEILDKKDKFA